VMIVLSLEKLNVKFYSEVICQHLRAGCSKYIVFMGPFSCLFWGMWSACVLQIIQNKQCMHFTGAVSHKHFNLLTLLSLKP
jgi:hypothetical protein